MLENNTQSHSPPFRPISTPHLLGLRKWAEKERKEELSSTLLFSDEGWFPRGCTHAKEWWLVSMKKKLWWEGVKRWKRWEARAWEDWAHKREKEIWSCMSHDPLLGTWPTQKQGFHYCKPIILHGLQISMWWFHSLKSI